MNPIFSYTKSLEEQGFSRYQSEALINTMENINTSTSVTKKEFLAFREEVNQRFIKIENRLSQLEIRFERMELRIDQLENRLGKKMVALTVALVALVQALNYLMFYPI